MRAESLTALVGQEIDARHEAWGLLLSLCQISQGQQSFPNGSSYAAIRVGRVVTDNLAQSVFEVEGGVVTAGVTQQIYDTAPRGWKLTFHPMEEEHEVDLGVHFASGGGKFVEGGYFTVAPLQKVRWIVGEIGYRHPAEPADIALRQGEREQFLWM